MDPLLQELVDWTNSGHWVKEHHVVSREDLLTVLEECVVVREFFLLPAPGKPDPWIATVAALLVHHLCVRDESWKRAVADRLVNVLEYHADIDAGPSARVRELLYYALCRSAPIEIASARALAEAEGVRESPSETALWAAAVYLSRACGVELSHVINRWSPEGIRRFKHMQEQTSRGTATDAWEVLPEERALADSPRLFPT